MEAKRRKEEGRGKVKEETVEEETIGKKKGERGKWNKGKVGKDIKKVG